MMNPAFHTPGTLLRARGREWVVLAGSNHQVLRLRPITGSEEDATLIHVGLELEGVSEASFPPPEATQRASHDGALLLRDSLLLSLRRGAGPFRSIGQIAVEPRAYQLVPLLMALKQPTVRLLIADDVGIGKTIEAALIAREMLDRGDVSRMAVLVPPHLVEQWVSELDQRFHIRSVPVTASSAARLERELPPSESVFSAHPFTVVSLDYIKNDRRRSEFLRACPDLVLVDEAHTCTSAGRGRHQRYELLKDLSENPQRHLVLLTATPHSGDEEAFYRLLGLLDAGFQRLNQLQGLERDALRERLALHFVQRRRPDIEAWKEQRLFPKRETKELTYRLTGAWEQFFESVLDYCHEVVQSAQGDQRRERLTFWGTLALLRCAASSPAAAVQALRTRAGLENAEDTDLESRVFDGDSDSLNEDDGEPPIANDHPALMQLISQAEALAGTKGDPKLKLLTDHLSELLEGGFNPVVFCRYISTARYLGQMLQGRFKAVTVEVVTGELTAEERKERVEALSNADRRLLVATDCLSEGINLQDSFDSVVHYDLSWNPTRHEQREGRVDRFGQKQPVVRTTLLYGANNPVDGAVLEVILRKATKIREELGVPVPIPDDGNTLSQALLKAVLMRQRRKEVTKQLAFDFMTLPAAQNLDARWQDAADRAKRNRTVFAQRRLKPEEVLPEWDKTLAAIGSDDQVRQFVQRAVTRLGSGMDPLRRGYSIPLQGLPEEVRERLESEGLSGTLLVDFKMPCSPRCRPVTRSHPLVAVLAESLLARTLNGETDPDESEPAVLGRAGCWVSGHVATKTTVVLLRLRHQLLAQRAGQTSTLLVEEASALAFAGAGAASLYGPEALSLLEPPPFADPHAHVRERMVKQALEVLNGKAEEIASFAEARAQALLADHRRVREASDAKGSYAVKALLPADIIGVFVLLPKVD